MITKKEAIQYLDSRSEFKFLEDAVFTYKNLNCFKSTTNVFNQDWIDFSAKALILNADGFPRYSYFGQLYLLDVAILDFTYRGLRVYIGNSQIENYTADKSILFDNTIVGAGAVSLIWQFNGIEIDRGA